MDVDLATAKHKFEHAGKSYAFCCAGCLEKFKAAPEKYLKPAGLTQIAVAPAKAVAPPTSTVYVCPMCPEVRETKPVPCPKCGMALEPETPVAASRVEYTCPMHPEIVRPGPGACPICGMALEPRTVAAKEEENPELRDMTRRFWVSLLLTVPLLGITMADMLPGMPVKTALPLGRLAVARTPFGYAGGAMGRVAVLPAGMGVDRQPLHQHVHADRDGHRRGLRLQRDGDIVARMVSVDVSGVGRSSGGVLRGGGGDHNTGFVGSGAGAAGAQPDRGGDPGAA